MRTKRSCIQFARMVFVWLPILLVVAVPRTSLALDIYVSVDGGADADGSLAKPSGSLRAAVKAVRALRCEGNTEPAVIYLREGRHQLDETLVLGLEDGSPTAVADGTLPQYGAGDKTDPAFLTFAAYQDEHPVVSAGVPITGWNRRLLICQPKRLVSCGSQTCPPDWKDFTPSTIRKHD